MYRKHFKEINTAKIFNSVDANSPRDLKGKKIELRNV